MINYGKEDEKDSLFKSEIFLRARDIISSSPDSVKFIKNEIIYKIDCEWIDKIEQTIPYLDAIVRNPSIDIKDKEQVLPVEFSKYINEKSLVHLSQHSDCIREMKNGDIIPEKLLNICYDSSYLTYENRFVNTLINKILMFLQERYRKVSALNENSCNYCFAYKNEILCENENKCKIDINMEFSSEEIVGSDKINADCLEIKEPYISNVDNCIFDKGTNRSDVNAFILCKRRIEKLILTIQSYKKTQFSRLLGKNYIKPPIIRTNGILKNKNLKECLSLWEYIDGFTGNGYSEIKKESEQIIQKDIFVKKFISSFYDALAVQYIDVLGCKENISGWISKDSDEVYGQEKLNKKEENINDNEKNSERNCEVQKIKKGKTKSNIKKTFRSRQITSQRLSLNESLLKCGITRKEYSDLPRKKKKKVLLKVLKNNNF